MDDDLDFRNKIHRQADMRRKLSEIADGLHIDLLFLDFETGLFLNGDCHITGRDGAVQFASFARLCGKSQRDAIDMLRQVLEFGVEFRTTDLSLRTDLLSLLESPGCGKHGKSLREQEVAAIASGNLLHLT
jgi:hypothetical protein